jgi:hypothetical protein
MKAEPPKKKDVTSWAIACLGVWVLLGIIIGQLFDPEHPGRLHIVSLTGQGAAADLLLVFVAVLVLVACARITVMLRPGWLVLLGLILLAIASGSSFLITRISPNQRFSIPFLPAAITEFIGAVLVGSGLGRLIWREKIKPPID